MPASMRCRDSGKSCTLDLGVSALPTCRRGPEQSVHYRPSVNSKCRFYNSNDGLERRESIDNVNNK